LSELDIPDEMRVGGREIEYASRRAVKQGKRDLIRSSKRQRHDLPPATTQATPQPVEEPPVIVRTSPRRVEFYPDDDIIPRLKLLEFDEDVEYIGVEDGGFIPFEIDDDYILKHLIEVDERDPEARGSREPPPSPMSGALASCSFDTESYSESDDVELASDSPDNSQPNVPEMLLPIDQLSSFQKKLEKDERTERKKQKKDKKQERVEKALAKKVEEDAMLVTRPKATAIRFYPNTRTNNGKTSEFWSALVFCACDKPDKAEKHKQQVTRLYVICDTTDQLYTLFVPLEKTALATYIDCSDIKWKVRKNQWALLRLEHNRGQPFDISDVRKFELLKSTNEDQELRTGRSCPEYKESLETVKSLSWKVEDVSRNARRAIDSAVRARLIPNKPDKVALAPEIIINRTSKMDIGIKLPSHLRGEAKLVRAEQVLNMPSDPDDMDYDIDDVLETLGFQKPLVVADDSSDSGSEFLEEVPPKDLDAPPPPRRNQGRRNAQVYTRPAEFAYGPGQRITLQGLNEVFAIEERAQILLRRQRAMEVHCQRGLNCYVRGCRHIHPDGWDRAAALRRAKEIEALEKAALPPPCRWGVVCNKASCRFSHPRRRAVLA
jgi:hypothetical protein